MTFSEIFDRFFWSLVLALFIGLLWLIFIDPSFPHIMVGVALSLLIGGTYFFAGIRKLVREKRLERRLEEEAYRELMEELSMGNDDA